MKNKFRKIVYVILVLSCLIVFTFCIMKCITIIQDKYHMYKENKKIEKLQEEKKKQENITREEVVDKEKILPSKEEQTEKETVEQEILQEYKKFYNQNNDLYGWIKIEGVEEMNYPVMYNPEDPNFYVNRDFDKNVTDKGSIYVDGYCQPDNENLILYGHNFKDLSMFGILSCYKDKKYYDEHKYIQFDTIYEKSTYEIIAVSYAFIKKEDLMDPEDKGKYENISFYEVDDEDYLFYEHRYLDNEQEFEEYLNNMKDNSYYQIDASAKYGDRLITLCTCTNIKEYQNKRLLVIAKKIK